MKKLLRITDSDLSEAVNVLDVANLQKLEKLSGDKDQIYEADTEYLMLRSHVCFRVVKLESKPKTLFCQTVELNPDTSMAKVTLSVPDLMKYSVQNKLLVLETKARASRTPKVHVNAHNRAIRRSGFCALCKRAQSKYASTIAEHALNELKPDMEVAT